MIRQQLQMAQGFAVRSLLIFEEIDNSCVMNHILPYRTGGIGQRTRRQGEKARSLA